MVQVTDIYSSPKRPVYAFLFAVIASTPWILIELLGLAHNLGTPATAALAGTSILGAAFLLTWAAETAEKDVPRSFALAVLAVIAVAPEYAVDALYAWRAGMAPGTPESNEAAQLAVANMTGANRILIGLGWSGIALYTLYRALKSEDIAVENRSGFLRDRVELDDDISLEIAFLSIATLYAFIVPLNGVLDGFDMLFLVGLYIAYIYFTLQTPHREEVPVGVPAYFQSLPRRARILAVITLFLFSGFAILLAVEPFAHGLEEIGRDTGVSAFFMIQWVAPLASETPEFIITAYLVNKARTTAAFNALISSKLNQWTLLIGTLVVVYSISYGQYGELPLDQRQMGEIWLTAAQSYFAIAILLDFDISAREALMLLTLFGIQLLPVFHTYPSLIGFSLLYITLGSVLVIQRRHHVRRLIRLTRRQLTS